MMPKVRILQSISGLDFSWVPGETVDMTDDDAQVWADGQRAELIEPDPDRRSTTGTQPEPEKAAQRSRGGGRAGKTQTRKAAEKSAADSDTDAPTSDNDAAQGDTAGAESAADGSDDPARGGSTAKTGK